MSDQFSSLAAWLRLYGKQSTRAQDRKKFIVAADAVQNLLDELTGFEKFIEDIPEDERTVSLNRILDELKTLKESLK